MVTTRHTAEEIVAERRRVGVLVSRGHSAAQVIRPIDSTEVTYGTSVLMGRREAQVVTGSERRHHNTIRPHASLGEKPLTSEVLAPACRVAGCASPARFAGHAPAGAEFNPKVTFVLDHPISADQHEPSVVTIRTRNCWRELMRLWSVLVLSAILSGCLAPTRQEQVAATGRGKHIAYNGAGGYTLPDGTTVAADRRGGFTLPNGAYVAPDGAGGLILPNGSRCVSDGARGYLCP